MSIGNIDELDILSYDTEMAYKRIYINAKALIEFFGGATEMAAKFTQFGYEELNRQTIYKWSERGSIPVERWLQAEQIAIKDGTYVDMRKACVVISSPAKHPSNEAEQQ